MPISIDVVNIADWTGLDGDTAVSTIEAQGVTVVRNDVSDPVVLDGVVISQLVEATAFGTQVTLTVSSGPMQGSAYGSLQFMLRIAI